jgi:acyl dehydratase
MLATAPIDELSSQGAVDWWSPVRPANAQVRFPPPLPVGDRVRMRLALDAVEPIQRGTALSLTLTFERVYE